MSTRVCITVSLNNEEEKIFSEVKKKLAKKYDPLGMDYSNSLYMKMMLKELLRRIEEEEEHDDIEA